MSIPETEILCKVKTTCNRTTKRDRFDCSNHTSPLLQSYVQASVTYSITIPLCLGANGFMR